MRARCWTTRGRGTGRPAPLERRSVVDAIVVEAAAVDLDRTCRDRARGIDRSSHFDPQVEPKIPGRAPFVDRAGAHRDRRARHVEICRRAEPSDQTFDLALPARLRLEPTGPAPHDRRRERAARAERRADHDHCVAVTRLAGREVLERCRGRVVDDQIVDVEALRRRVLLRDHAGHAERCCPPAPLRCAWPRWRRPSRPGR